MIKIITNTAGYILSHPFKSFSRLSSRCDECGKPKEAHFEIPVDEKDVTRDDV